MFIFDYFDAIPRIPLAEYPTPLEFLPRLSVDLGRPVFVKRDDMLGPGTGGNKTRKLEYLLAEAQRRGLRKVATFGGLQSNHARLTAAAANRLGMETHLFYFEARPRELTGNLAINRLLGAKMHFIPFGGGGGKPPFGTAGRGGGGKPPFGTAERGGGGKPPYGTAGRGGGGMTLEKSIFLAHLVALAVAGRHYFIPVGGHNWLGGLGYVRAAFEIDDQVRALGLEKAHLVLAAGSGGTLAGLMAGMALCGSDIRLLGIDVGKLWKAFPASIASLAAEICRRLGHPHAFSASQVPLIEEMYVGGRYGAPSEAGQCAMKRLARLEGLLLDPVYTAKAFAGLLGEVEKGHLGKDEPVIFLHTGGFPALFAFGENSLDPGRLC